MEHEPRRRPPETRTTLKLYHLSLRGASPLGLPDTALSRAASPARSVRVGSLARSFATVAPSLKPLVVKRDLMNGYNVPPSPDTCQSSFGGVRCRISR